VRVGVVRADTLNVYTIWSERYATEVFKAFTKDTGIQVRHLRFSSGEVLARIIGEKDNPQVDVFFGGIADAFVAGKEGGRLRGVRSEGAEAIPAKYRDRTGTGPASRWTRSASCSTRRS
jgi:iron(III) transport system substrate-binding protein